MYVSRHESVSDRTSWGCVKSCFMCIVAVFVAVVVGRERDVHVHVLVCVTVCARAAPRVVTQMRQSA